MLVEEAAPTDQLRTALAKNPKAVVFGEDVAFGGVFVSWHNKDGLCLMRCSDALPDCSRNLVSSFMAFL